MRYEPIHHTIVAIDVVASGGRDDQLLLHMRRDLRGIVRDALSRQSVDLAALDRTDLGDGLRLAVPSSVSASTLLDPFVPALDAALRGHRKISSPEARLRMRMVVHHGLVHLDDGVWAGAPMVHCARLLDADPLRHVMAAMPEANLGLAVSESIYDSVVRHGYGLDPNTYQRFGVVVKETDATAWIHVPGFRPPFPVGDQSPPVSRLEQPPSGLTNQNLAMGNAHVGAQIGSAGTVHIGRPPIADAGTLRRRIVALRARLVEAGRAGRVDREVVADVETEIATALAHVGSADLRDAKIAVRALRKANGLVGDVDGFGPTLTDLIAAAEESTR